MAGTCLIDVTQTYLDNLISIIQSGHAELALAYRNKQVLGIRESCYNCAIEEMAELSDILFYLMLWDVDNDNCLFVHKLKERAMGIINFSESDILNSSFSQLLKTENNIVFLNEVSSTYVSGEGYSTVSNLTYSNNGQLVDMASADSAFGTSFTSMSPTISPSGASVTYSASGLPAGLSLDVNTGVITESVWENIPVGLNVWTITATGTSGFNGTSVFTCYLGKAECVDISQANYDSLSDPDNEIYYLIIQ